MKKLLWTIFAALFFHFGAYSQTEVSGKVTSRANQEPLPGVSILVKETGTGVVTNEEGEFSLTVPEAGRTLVFS